MKTHDYSSDKEKAELIVRKGERYGAALPGDHVIVDARELRNASTMSACMTLEDHALEEEKRAAKAAKKLQSSGLKSYVEQELARITEARAKEAESKKAAAEKDKSGKSGKLGKSGKPSKPDETETKTADESEEIK